MYLRDSVPVNDYHNNVYNLWYTCAATCSVFPRNPNSLERLTLFKQLPMMLPFDLQNCCVKLNRDVDIRWIFYAQIIDHIYSGCIQWIYIFEELEIWLNLMTSTAQLIDSLVRCLWWTISQSRQSVSVFMLASHVKLGASSNSLHLICYTAALLCQVRSHTDVI